MTLEALFVMLVVLGSCVLVQREWLSADAAFMAGLSLVTVAGILEPGEAVRGFAHSAVFAVASIYVVVAGLKRAGIFDRLFAHAVEGSVDGTRWQRALDALGLARILGFDTSSHAESHATPDPKDVHRDDATSTSSRELWIGCGILATLVVLPATGTIRFETSAILGAVSVVVSGLLSPEAARRAVNWELVVVIGAVIGLSDAFVATGALEAAHTWVPTLAAELGPSLPLIVVVASMGLLSALDRRRAAASILPVLCSVGLLASMGIGV